MDIRDRYLVRGRREVPRVVWSVYLILLLAACASPRPTIKIAIVAPFEGRFREVGYDAFPAFRLALRDQMRAGPIGNYEVEFVAYNDNADPTFAERVAHNVVIDPQVVAVIGHLRTDTTLAAMSVYSNAMLSLVVPDVPADLIPQQARVFRIAPSTARLTAGLESCEGQKGTISVQGTQPYRGDISPTILQRVADISSSAAPRVLGNEVHGLCFASATPYPHDYPLATATLSTFSEVSGGPGPAPRSISAYDATRLILDAIRVDIQDHRIPSRAGVAEALRTNVYHGLLGTIRFDSTNIWPEAPVFVYQYDQSGNPIRLK